jgi:hypothetical protein
MRYSDLISKFSLVIDEQNELRTKVYHTVKLSDEFFALVYFSPTTMEVKIELLAKRGTGVTQFKSPISDLPLSVISSLGQVSNLVLDWIEGKYDSLDEALEKFTL